MKGKYYKEAVDEYTILFNMDPFDYGNINKF